MEEKGKTCLVLGIWQFDLKGLPLLSWWLPRKKNYLQIEISISLWGWYCTCHFQKDIVTQNRRCWNLAFIEPRVASLARKGYFVCAVVIIESNGPIRRKPHKEICVFLLSPPVRGKSRLIWYFILAQSKIDFPSHVAQSTFQGLLLSKRLQYFLKHAFARSIFLPCIIFLQFY